MKSIEYKANFCPTCGRNSLVEEKATCIFYSNEEPVMYCQNELCGMTYFKVILEV